MVLVALTAKSVKTICNEYNLKQFKKDTIEDGVKILALADCDFYSSKKALLTQRPTLISSGKNVAAHALRKQKCTFVAFQMVTDNSSNVNNTNDDGDVYFMMIKQYSSKNEIDQDFLNYDTTKTDRGFQSKHGTSILKANQVNISTSKDGKTFIMKPKSKNGLLFQKELKVTPILDATNANSDENYIHCIEFLKNQQILNAENAN